MRMGWFWGILLILVGIAILANMVFGIHIPIFRTLVALFFIFLGVKLLLGNWWSPFALKGEKQVLLHSQTFDKLGEGKNDYDVIFGKGTFDLTNAALAGPAFLNVDTVFGASEIFIPRDLPVKIEVDVAFGGARLPNQENGGFGKFTYQSDTYAGSEIRLTIKASAVFGSVEITRR